MVTCWFLFFFFFNDTATTEIYTLSLHDALPILMHADNSPFMISPTGAAACYLVLLRPCRRSEEHTSELQSRRDLVCRLLLEKKKKTKISCLALQQKHNTTKSTI